MEPRDSPDIRLVFSVTETRPRCSGFSDFFDFFWANDFVTLLSGQFVVRRSALRRRIYDRGLRLLFHLQIAANGAQRRLARRLSCAQNSGTSGTEPTPRAPHGQNDPKPNRSSGVGSNPFSRSGDAAKIRKLGADYHAAAGLKVIRPGFPALRFGFMTISISWSNAVSIFIRRSTE